MTWHGITSCYYPYCICNRFMRIMSAVNSTVVFLLYSASYRVKWFNIEPIATFEQLFNYNNYKILSIPKKNPKIKNKKRKMCIPIASRSKCLNSITSKYKINVPNRLEEHWPIYLIERNTNVYCLLNLISGFW